MEVKQNQDAENSNTELLMPEDNVLVYSRGEDKRLLYLLDGEKPDQTTVGFFELYDVELTDDPHVRSLAFHNRKLYDGSDDGKIRETLTGNLVAERPGLTIRNGKSTVIPNAAVQSLCSSDVALYDCGNYGKIYNTLTGEMIAERPGSVWSLCSHKGELHDLGSNAEIHETLTGEKVMDRMRSGAIHGIFSYDDTWYDYGSSGIHETLTGKLVAERAGTVWSLCSHNGDLYDGSGEGIHETLTGKLVAEGRIFAMASVPRSIFLERVQYFSKGANKRER